MAEPKLPVHVHALAGSNNALWQYGRYYLERRQYAKLRQGLQKWQPIIWHAKDWDTFGYDHSRAREVNDGTIEVFLALAWLKSRGEQRWSQTLHHLAKAAARYEGLPVLGRDTPPTGRVSTKETLSRDMPGSSGESVARGR